MVLSGGDSISVTPALSLPLLREDGVIQLRGNLRRTNCDGLCTSLFSSLGSALLSEGMSWGVGCRGPGWEAAVVQITVKGAQYWKVYLLTDISCIFNIASTRHLSCFVSQLAHKSGRKKECHLLGPLQDPNRSWKPRQNLNNYLLSALTLCLHVRTRKGGWRNCLLLSAAVLISCL